MCSQQLLVMCMPAAAIGRPALDPWVPSSALFCNTHVCVCSQQQFGLPKLLNVQNPQSTPSLSFAATHMYSRISNGSAKPQLASSATHMCVCAHSSNYFGKVIERSRPSVDFSIDFFGYTQVCAHSSHWSASPRPGSETSLLAEEFKGSTHMCVLTAAIGLSTLDPWLQPQQH